MEFFPENSLWALMLLRRQVPWDDKRPRPPMADYKQRFTRWWCKRKDKKIGHFWGERFKSVLLGGPGALAAQSDEPPKDGSARGHAHGGGFDVYDAELDRWVEPTRFWLNYAERRGGLTWGRGAAYPPYGEVKEFDTFLVELDQGPCLMEFFHTRWRRANDVRRWNDRFNDYGGCPHVFD